MGEHLDLNLTLLGIDVQHGTTVHNDLNEASLIDIIGAHVNEDGPPLLLLLSPMGGQGASSGANLHPPDVLRPLGTATSSGWRRRRNSLDSKPFASTRATNRLAEFQAKRFIKILQGFRTTDFAPLNCSLNVALVDRFCEKVRTRTLMFCSYSQRAVMV